MNAGSSEYGVCPRCHQWARLDGHTCLPDSPAQYFETYPQGTKAFLEGRIAALEAMNGQLGLTVSELQARLQAACYVEAANKEGGKEGFDWACLGELLLKLDLAKKLLAIDPFQAGIDNDQCIWCGWLENHHHRNCDFVAWQKLNPQE